MLVEALIIAIIMGYIRKGRLKNLTRLTLTGYWLVPIALVAQLIVQRLGSQGNVDAYKLISMVLHLGSYVLLISFIILNRTLKGMLWLLSGVLLNGLVIAANGGMMPVDPAYLTEAQISTQLARDGIHGMLTAETRIPILADRFYLSLPWLGAQLFSIGDILMDIGVIRLIVTGMMKVK